jgi:hypothetical protein
VAEGQPVAVVEQDKAPPILPEGEGKGEDLSEDLCGLVFGPNIKSVINFSGVALSYMSTLFDIEEFLIFNF